MAEFWEEWGALAYVGAALWAFFEGETFVLAAAAVGAVAGGIDPWILMFAVWGGSFAGDQTWFTLGRRFGPAVMRRFPGAEKRFSMASAMLHKHGTVFILGFRFLYGIRNVAAAACGMAGMDRTRFVILNFIGAGIWASSFVAAGWYLGALIGADNLFYCIATAALLVLGIYLFKAARNRRRKLAAADTGS